MRLIITTLIALFLSPATYAAENLFTLQNTVTPSLATFGPHQVGVRTIKFKHLDQLSADFQSRNDRSLTVEVWYPGTPTSDMKSATYEDETRSGKPFSLIGDAVRNLEVNKSTESYPLLVISHGYTGYRSMMFYLAEHLASHGYVVASIDHTDSTNADIDFAKNPGSGFPSTLYNRARDQQFVMNALMKNNEFKPAINQNLAAVIGYSMGGYGALNTVGGCYNFSPTLLKTMQFPQASADTLPPLLNYCNADDKTTDTRWKAVIVLAPWGGEQGVHSLENMRVPALFVAGEKDDISGFESGVKALYEASASKQKYLMVYENARHNIAAHPAPKVAYNNDLDIGHYYEPSWNSETMCHAATT